MYILFNILILGSVLGFRSSFFRLRQSSFLKLSNNEPVNKNNVTIFNVDFGSMIDDFDNHVIQNIYNGNIPMPPQSEEEIVDDSFEGYLREHFKDICVPRRINTKGRLIIDFPTFYNWRMNIGTVLTKEELEEIYNTIIDNKEGCDLMDFILINKVIDENDGADYIL